MYDDMTIAWDGSAAADRALDWALDSPLSAAHTTVLRVMTGSRSDETYGEASDGVEAAIARGVLAHPHRQIEREVVAADLEDELLRRAEPGRLLVVGSPARHRHPQRFRFTLGSRVAARAHGPVAVVPEDAPAASGRPVLVGVDGTSASFAAARIAARIADDAHLGLVVLHAWQEVGDPDEVRDDGVVDEVLDGGHDRADESHVLPEAHRAIAEEIMTMLQDEFEGVSAESRVVHGPAPAVLVDAAADASLLVVGKHGRFTSSSLLLGSVAHAVLLASPVPVLVVSRHDGEVVARPAATAVAAVAG